MSELHAKLEREVLPLVSKPGRYVGGERNVSTKNVDDAELTFLLAFPDVYEIGMSHLGLRVLYDILNRREEIAAERVFAPWTDMEVLLREKGLPLFSIESRRPARDFDVIGFTLQYELHATGVLAMLDLAGVPVRAAARGEDDPVVLGGGPGAFNPEPVAAFFDAVVVGDGESAILDIADALIEAKRDGLARVDALRRLAGVPGVYVPSLHEERSEGGRYVGTVPIDAAAPPVVARRVEPALDASSHPACPIVPLTEVTHDRLSVEIMRGCTRGCRFCQAGMITRPVRSRPVADVVRLVEEGIAGSGCDEVSLVSLSSSDYEGLSDLVARLNQTLFDRRVSVSLPSLRLDSFSLDLAQGIGMVRRAGLTFAPEAGTQRLRDVINKNETEENLVATVDAAFEAGWNRVKLYFMIGLPTETDEDILGIVELVKRLRRTAQARKPGAQINVSISPFVPKPHTPFQWEAQETREEIRRKQRLLLDGLRMRGVRTSVRDPEVSFLECAISRGDRGLADAIEAAWLAGARLEGWTEHFDPEIWRRAFEGAGIDPTAFTGALETEAPLPWDHIAGGPTKAFLLEEREKAFRGEATPDCREDGCYECGACGPEGRDPREMPPRVDLGASLEPKQVYGRTTRRKLKNGSSDLTDRWRIRYAKGRAVRFLSHLDLVRLFARAVTVSDLPVAYSQGFNPHPKFSFGPPLPVGSTGEAEFLDIEFVRPIGEKEIEAKLADALPGGLEVLGLTPLRSKEKVAAGIAAAEYVVRDAVALEGLAPEDLRARAAEVKATGTATVRRGDALKEVRPAEGILEVEVLEDGGPGMRMLLAVGIQGALRPSDVIELLAGPGARAASLAMVHRTRIYRRPAGRSDLEPV